MYPISINLFNPKKVVFNPSGVDNFVESIVNLRVNA